MCGRVDHVQSEAQHQTQRRLTSFLLVVLAYVDLRVFGGQSNSRDAQVVRLYARRVSSKNELVLGVVGALDAAGHR